MYTVPEAVSLQPRPAAGRWFEAGREIEQNRTGLRRSLWGQEGTVDPWREDRLAKKGIRCDTEQPRGANRSQWIPTYRVAALPDGDKPEEESKRNLLEENREYRFLES